MHRRWLSLPLLSTCASAFYPYIPQDGGSENNKRFIPLDVESRPHDDSGVFTLDVKRVMKRNNIFPVVNSAPPSVPNAMGINEDGNDYTYFSTMKFGSQNQEMYMLIDTGSANTWVMGDSCASKACQTHNLYDSSASTTLQTTTQPWSMTYGTGEVDGTVVKDTIQLANYTVSMGFGLATTASDDFNSYPMDGIVGLGRAASDTLNSPTMMQVLDSQGHLSSNILGIHLQRDSDGTNDGQITFGGIDTTKFTGKLTYSSTISDSSWQIAAGDAGVNGKAVGFQGKTGTVDTGTSYILMPPADAVALHNLIPGSSQNGEVFVIPCDTTADVYIALNGVKYGISTKDIVGKPNGNGCQSNIIGHQAYGPNDWILGDVFLKNVYTVFDFDNARVGFGTKSGAAASGGSASTTTSSSPSATGSGSSASGKPTTSSTGGSTSKPSTTMATSTTKSSSSTSTSTAATSSSSGPNSSDPFTQSGNGGPSSSSTNDARSTSSSSILAMVIFAFVVGILV